MDQAASLIKTESVGTIMHDLEIRRDLVSFFGDT